MTMHRILLAAACARAAAANATRAGALRNGTAGAKIFGVGFKKTATESLLSAYDALGLGVACGEACRADAAALWSGAWKTGARDLGAVVELARRYDFFQDSPWCDAAAPLYPALAAAFPDARFVLTVRPVAAWWPSVKRWLGCVKPSKRREYADLLGVAAVEERAFTDAYARHNAAVAAFFADAPERLLVVDLTDPARDHWRDLCAFFGVRAGCPAGALPHRHNQRKKADACAPPRAPPPRRRRSRARRR